MPSGPNTLILSRLSGVNSAVAIKAPCRAASTTPITLAGMQTIDGVTFLATDAANFLNTRVLVMGQTDQTTNGIYNVQVGAWTRAPDADGNDDLVQGCRVQVVQGTVNQGVYTLATADPVFLTNSGQGVSNIIFVFQVSQQLINLAVGTTTAVNGVTAAIAVPGNINTILTLRYYATDGDGGGGTFFWSTANHATDVANDPGRAIFIPSFGDLTGATGAWVRQYSGPVNIRWFGATGNGVTADDGAFMHFNIWARAQATAVNLLIPPGTYHISGASSPQSFGAGADLVSTSQWLYGISSVRVSGYGATTDGLFLGGAGPFQDNLHYGLTNAITQGATSITLANSSDASKFSTNTWALLGQIDTQGFGYPQNLAIFEYVFITNISGGTITVRDQIKHNYLTTFPNYSAGDSGHANLGGPATLFAMAAAWNSDITISGMTFTGSQLFGGMRKVHFIDCDATAVGNWAPSNSQYYTIERCKLAPFDEVDKLIEHMTFIECECQAAGNSVQIVSASVENVNVVRCRFGGFISGGKYTRIEQSSIGLLIFGASFGNAESLTITDSEIITFTPATNSTPHALSSFTFANGVFSIATSSGPLVDAVPGAVYFFYDTNDAVDNLGTPFRVLDITASGGNTHIATTLQAIPTLFDLSNNPISAFTRHPCTRLTVRNCTGHPDIVNLSKAAAYGLPPYSYGEYTVITGAAVSVAIGPRLWGQLVSLTINVIRAYTGAQATLTMDAGGQFGVFVVNSSGNVVHNAFNSQVNLKIAGIRTITPTGVTGAQSGDNITSPGANNAWLVFGIGPFMSAATGGDTLDQQAIVEVQCTTDQGAVCTVPLLYNQTSGPIPVLPA